MAIPVIGREASDKARIPPPDAVVLTPALYRGGLDPPIIADNKIWFAADVEIIVKFLEQVKEEDRSA